MHRMPCLHGSFSTKETYHQWSFCGKRPIPEDILCIAALKFKGFFEMFGIKSLLIA